MTRTLLGKQSTLTRRSRTFLAPGALEIETVDGYTGTRRQVLFDEVTLVTVDRRRRVVTLSLYGVMAAVFGFFAFVSDERPVVVVMSLFALFATIMFSLEALGRNFVTVFGKRGNAQIVFALRRGRARKVYDTICDEIRRAQSTSPVTRQP